jgi:hypothetical protein
MHELRGKQSVRKYVYIHPDTVRQQISAQGGFSSTTTTVKGASVAVSDVFVTVPVIHTTHSIAEATWAYLTMHLL